MNSALRASRCMRHPGSCTTQAPVRPCLFSLGFPPTRGDQCMRATVQCPHAYRMCRACYHSSLLASCVLWPRKNLHASLFAFPSVFILPLSRARLLHVLHSLQALQKQKHVSNLVWPPQRVMFLVASRCIDQTIFCLCFRLCCTLPLCCSTFFFSSSLGMVFFATIARRDAPIPRERRNTRTRKEVKRDLWILFGFFLGGGRGGREKPGILIHRGS